MAQNVREQVFSGAKWNALGKFGHYGVQFFVSIILARLLLPAEFGLVGMLAIFTAIAQVFITSGLSSALIQKKDADSTDYATVFYFNIAVAIVFYLILFFSAKYIAIFYKQPELTRLTKYMAIVFLINAFGTVQATILTKELQFKKLNLISITGVFLAGTVAIVMAYKGFGVYAIIGQSISYALITNIIYWISSDWKPKFIFSKNSFKILFGFGSKLLVSSLLDQIYNNLSTLIIGKAFSASQLGYFTRAKATRDLPIQNTTGILSNILLPVFSKVDNDEDLLRHHLKFIGLISFVIFPMMVGLAIVAEPLTVILFSEKWLPSVPILQLLCIIGPSYPLSVILTNTILAKGKAGLFLKLDIYKKIVGVTAMIIGLYFGFYAFLIGIIISSVVGLLINFIATGNMFKIKLMQYIKVMSPATILSTIMGCVVYLTSFVIPDNYYVQLFALSILGIVFYFVFSHIFKLNDYIYLIGLAKEKLFSKKVKINNEK